MTQAKKLRLKIATNEIVLDDAALLKDRLLRSLHRDKQGHLAESSADHKNAVDARHNVAVLYVYHRDTLGFWVVDHYVHSYDPLTHREWEIEVLKEIQALERAKEKTYVGVYGWLTSKLTFTPMRTGDVFIKIDSAGATGVRLTFGAGKDD